MEGLDYRGCWIIGVLDYGSVGLLSSWIIGVLDYRGVGL